ncbi:MAG: class I SAM-dependent methyltransferase [Anaerolineales bacterium]
MTNFEDNLRQVKAYFKDKLVTYGATAQGADWNSPQSQEIRFDQLIKVIREVSGFSILDYGCGYGALADYLCMKGYEYTLYVGYDILEPMIQTARQLHEGMERIIFTSDIAQIPTVDYAVASGVFNIRLNASYEQWTEYTLACLEKLNTLTSKGFSVNFLTKYSDKERMEERPDLYFADPCFLFDYCKRRFSKNVALLHDYNLYDFTILVRKQ